MWKLCIARCRKDGSWIFRLTLHSSNHMSITLCVVFNHQREEKGRANAGAMISQRK